MRATLERLVNGRTLSGGMLHLLGMLLLVGVVLAGCSSQGGSTGGPTHPSQQTGAPDGGVLLTLVVQEGPGANQFTVIVLLESIARAGGGGGRPLQGSIVSVLTTAGRLVPTRGSTDATGVFRSILTCDDDGATSTITASSEGQFQQAGPVCGAPGVPATPPGTPPGTPPITS
jgi:hypothetical protein